MSPGESLALVARFATATARGSRRPRPLETVEEWGTQSWVAKPRRGSSVRFSRADTPGIGVSERITPVWPGRAVHAPCAEGSRGPSRRGMRPPESTRWACRLRTRDVTIRLNTPARLDGSTPAVICTSACDAAEILRDVAPVASQALSTIDMLPLVRITAFYADEETHQRGRGVLFPRGGGIRALGVVFNKNIFPHRGRTVLREFGIYGGAANGDI